MVGEELGWVPLEGWTIVLLILEMFVIILIPGFLLSLALFPKRRVMALSERMAIALGLGLAPALILTLLNITLEVNVNFITSLLVFVFVCISGVMGFLYRGGDINLLTWLRSKEAATSE